MKVAIVHDWLVGGGAEKVVLELHRMFPEAPIYTSYSTDEWRQKLDGKVVTGYLQRFPRIRKYIPFLRARWFSHLKLSGFGLVISSSGAEAKGIKVPDGTVHINYCHAPTHYYWSRHEEYMKHPGFGILDPLARLGLHILVDPMRHWDYKAAQRPHYMIANSSYTQSQIKKYYGRDSVVIHPPVDIEKFQPSGENKRRGFIITGRQTPYKRFDLAIKTCTKLNLPLTVIGTGPDHEKLKKLGGPGVTFKGWVSQGEIIKSLQSAEAFLFPGIDDFGISAVEAMATGTPVIAFRAGGALDYVIEGKTGIFFEEQTVESLGDALQRFKIDQFSADEIYKSAEHFSPASFTQSMEAFIKEATHD